MSACCIDWRLLKGGNGIPLYVIVFLVVEMWKMLAEDVRIGRLYVCLSSESKMGGLERTSCFGLIVIDPLASWCLLACVSRRASPGFSRVWREP